MKIYEIVLCILSIVFCYYAHIIAYSKIFNEEIKKISFLKSIIILLIIVITFYNTFYNYGFSKILISFLSIYLVLKLVYDENLKTTFLKALILYLLGFIIEMLLGMFMAYFFINTVQQFDSNVLIKVSFSIFMMTIMLLLSSIKAVKKIFDKIYTVMNKIFSVTILMLLSIIILVLLTYYLIISTDIYSTGAIISLIIILFLLIFINVFQSIKTKKAYDKQEILLNFMKEYEMVIDKERMDRHEMVNNLLVLKSIKNKNTKSYDKVLDDILLTYQSNKTPSSLYELPSGLKGLFYYKVYDMKNNDIETFINISNKITKDLDRLDSKTLTKLCKILGILLDNAKDAAKESKDKLVVIDLYKEKGNIIIYIENSINTEKDIDINKMKLKGYSTKGNNRGYGLYIVNKLLNNNNKLDLSQEVKDNKFISILTIKNN